MCTGIAVQFRKSDRICYQPSISVWIWKQFSPVSYIPNHTFVKGSAYIVWLCYGSHRNPVTDPTVITDLKELRNAVQTSLPQGWRRTSKQRQQCGKGTSPFSYISSQYPNICKKMPKYRQRGEMERFKVVKRYKPIPVTKEIWHWWGYLCTLLGAVIIWLSIPLRFPTSPVILEWCKMPGGLQSHTH